MKLGKLLCLSVLTGIVPSTCASAAPADNQKQRDLFVKTMNEGNFKDAYEGFRKLALDPNDNPLQVGQDLNLATNCLQRLNRLGEVVRRIALQTFTSHAQDLRDFRSASHGHLPGRRPWLRQLPNAARG